LFTFCFTKEQEIIMGEQKMPNPNQNQTGNQPGQPNKNPQQDRDSASRPGQGQQSPQQDRESASRQPGKQFPDENQKPNERASNPDREDDAARRQNKQDPLQNRDR
jgi:hypothetical protein